MTTRHAYLEAFVARLSDELVLTSVGATARELDALAPRDGSLYRLHLGGTTAVALGLALALPRRRVVAFDGDGGILMGLSILPVMGQYAPPNLTVIVFDNRLYEGGGRLPTLTARGVDLVAIAVAAGIRGAIRVSDVQGFERALDATHWAGAASFILAEAEPGTQAPYNAMDGTENKYRFIHHVEETEGVQVLQGPSRPSAR